MAERKAIPSRKFALTLRGDPGVMLKFIQSERQPAAATGATIQIRLKKIAPTMAAALVAGAMEVMAPTDNLKAAVRMPVITTDQGLDIKLVQNL